MTNLEKGLLTAEQAEGDHASALLRESRDADAMAALRSRLDELMAGSIAKPLTRPNAIALLTALAECLEPALAEERNISASDLTLHLEHAAIGLLNQLIDALKDLDNGKVDDALKRSTHQANAGLTIRQRKEDQLLLELSGDRSKHEGL